jgi:RNA polymerase sigma factor (sigma-70 family)
MSAVANSRRNDQGWLADLRGQRGAEAQYDAYVDLSKYLRVVAYNYLLMRCGDIPLLATFDPDDLVALAEEFVQDTLEKLAANGHALLDGYQGSGHFTSWVAIIVRRVVSKELKRALWTQRHRTEESDFLVANSASIAIEVRTSLEKCLDKLSERQRQALLRCIVEEEAAKDVAADLKTNVNAVYLLVLKAKRKTKQCLQAAGIDEIDI